VKVKEVEQSRSAVFRCKLVALRRYVNMSMSNVRATGVDPRNVHKLPSYLEFDVCAIHA
jgi:hypothetical protein